MIISYALVNLLYNMERSPAPFWRIICIHFHPLREQEKQNFKEGRLKGTKLCFTTRRFVNCAHAQDIRKLTGKRKLRMY